MREPGAGWAVKQGVMGPLANTVSSTPRGAMVNWLVSQRAVWVPSTATDEEIATAFERQRLIRGVEAELVEVVIREKV